MSVPDASKMLILSRSASGGASAGLVTLIGVKVAEAVQVILVSIGLSWLIVAYPSIFEGVTLIGAIYLVYVGIKTWQADNKQSRQAKRRGSDFLTGFSISLANPKTIIFLGTLFPHFLNHAAPLDIQFALLGTTFLVIATLLDTPLVIGGGLVERLIHSPQILDWLKRLNSGVLLVAGVFLMGLFIFK
ncbi:LysE family translocator [Pseudovibrio sp. Tun.PSC04-5.I4]|uniref:LysE family translocator n=1 Tax=Pseudovibrio sp. Tun.PSC04-5.I4 TaxID=1798213 RepID=UPI000B8A15EE|nr:LysE family translocator [Pseudovibrio sp. Tun.PSC04-5.I4]